MDTTELNAPPRVPSRVRRPATRSGGPAARGVVHQNTRHRNRFTVVGNHLAQHSELSLAARGLAVYIQSLPDGVNIGIKFLWARFTESEARIAAALRELEDAGYLSRDRERLPDGRIVTRTVFRNQPGAEEVAQVQEQGVRDGHAVRKPRASAPLRPSVRRAQPSRTTPAPPQEHEQSLPHGELPPLWTGYEDMSPEPVPDPEPKPDREPKPVPEAASDPAPVPTPRPAKPERPLPTPQTFDPERDQAARDLLASLRQDDARLTLAERDVHQLGPAVASWLERQVAPDAVRRALTVRLPEQPRDARALIAHRLTVNMPGALPPAPVVVRPDPLQDCDGCGRVFRAPHPGRCRDCRTESEEAAQHERVGPPPARRHE